MHYHYAGRHPEAAAHYRDILTALQRLKGPEHPETLSAMGNLANSLNSSGELRQSYELHSRIYELRRKLLGASHPETLDSLSNLAVNAFGLGEDAEALKLQRELVEQRRLLLGAEHPHTLMAMHYLAYFQQNRDPAGAIVTHDQVLQLRRKVLGPEHPDTFITLHYQAYAYESLGRMEEAIALREAVVKGRIKVQGADHPQTQGAIIALSESYLRVNRTRDALPLLERVSTAKPADTLLALKVSALERWFQLETESRASVRRCLEQLASTKEPLAVSQMVLAVCVHPLLEPLQAREAASHAKRASEAAYKPEQDEFVRLARGLAELRAGHQAEAIPFFSEIIPSTGISNPIQAAAAAYAAIGLFQRSLPGDAQEYSDLARRWFKTHSVPQENPLVGERPLDLLVASIAFRELQAVMKGATP
jgi:tetratricopeptide (TPR) repeat protein